MQNKKTAGQIVVKFVCKDASLTVNKVLLFILYLYRAVARKLTSIQSFTCARKYSIDCNIECVKCHAIAALFGDTFVGAHT